MKIKPSAIKERVKTIRLGRPGNVSEVAELIYFLAFENKFITGQNIKIDGGDEVTTESLGDGGIKLENIKFQTRCHCFLSYSSSAECAAKSLTPSSPLLPSLVATFLYYRIITSKFGLNL